jgi:hypothetical protein
VKEYALRKKRDTSPVSPIAVGAADAAAMLGVSADHFERHVASDLRVIRSGRRKLYLTSDITRWAETKAARTLT